MEKNKQNNSTTKPVMILDLFGVLVLGSYNDTCQWVSDKYQLDYSFVYDIVYHKYFSDATRAKITEAQSFKLAAQELNLEETGKQLREIHLSFQKLNKEVLDLAQTWQKKGAQIVVFSKNTPQQFNEIVRLFNLRDYFPVIINSYNLKMEKKSKQALNYFLKRFKTTKDQVLMIDDQAYNFINANKMGIKTILYKSPKQLKKEVSAWLVKFK
jgi:HAD superfamily hydrolase (TIGR01509 family)